jgi:hypothetical protein
MERESKETTRRRWRRKRKREKKKCVSWSGAQRMVPAKRRAGPVGVRVRGLGLWLRIRV